ncbi:hypothetical protein CYMTET_53645 [Cymbomonas tetramitiformis]|uniref:Uncharacterized protein n=1 Tax=Cymbomonas tetramitiformis TaxID=36881 RepID=A0AAE0ERI5_9CHLO|nr:hypothetical protein CYMTET_53645 [Cymbomonas tetramitiformis]
MGMYHSTSGNCGFEPYEKPTRCTMDKQVLIQTLQLEEGLRNCQETQDAYTQALHNQDLLHLATITERLQIRALVQTGVILPSSSSQDVKQALIALHNARFQYAQDPTVNAITVYQRQNRSRQGTLRLGDAAPDVPLFTTEDEPTSLAKYDSWNKPLVLIVGSAS